MSQRPGAAQGAQQQWEGEFFCFFSRARLRVSPRRAGWARPNRCYALGWGRAGIVPRVSGASARPGPNLSRTGPLIFSKDTGLVPHISHRQRRSAAPSTANRPRRRIPGRGRCSRGPDPRPPPHALLSEGSRSDTEPQLMLRETAPEARLDGVAPFFTLDLQHPALRLPGSWTLAGRVVGP